MAEDPGDWVPVTTANDWRPSPKTADDWIPVSKMANSDDGPSASGAALRGAERGALPAVGGLAAAGAGAAAGAELGALTGPAAPIAVPALGLVGAVAGGLGGGALVGKAQDWALRQLPEGARETIGQSEKQQQADVAAHPYASMAGELAPNLALMRPGAVAQAAEGASAFERLMAHPATSRVIGGSLGAGQEVAQEEMSGQPIDPGKIALATGAGALMNKETRLGKGISGAGEGTVSAVTRPFKSSEPTATAPAQNAAPPATGNAAVPENAPDPGTPVGLKFPNAPSRRATVDSYWDNGDSVRLRYEDGTAADYLTKDFLRDQAAPPPPMNPEATRGQELSGKPITEQDAFDLMDAGDRSAPPEPSPKAVQGTLGRAQGQPDPLSEIARADRLESLARDPSSKMSQEQRDAAFVQAGILRSQFGRPAGEQGFTPGETVGVNPGSTPNLLGQEVPNVPRGTTADLGATNANPGSTPNLMGREVPNLPANMSPDLGGTVPNLGMAPNILGQEVPKLSNAPTQFTPEQLAAARAASAQAAQQQAPAAPELTLNNQPQYDRRTSPALVPVPALKAPTLMDWIRSMGGIKDTDGNVVALYDAAGKKPPPGIIANRSGTGIDDLAAQAQMAGYFPDRYDPNRSEDTPVQPMLDAIEAHLAGTPTYSVNDINSVQARQAAQAHNDQIKNLSAQYDIDHRGMTAEQLYAEVRNKRQSLGYNPPPVDVGALHDDLLDEIEERHAIQEEPPLGEFPPRVLQTDHEIDQITRSELPEVYDDRWEYDPYPELAEPHPAQPAPASDIGALVAGSELAAGQAQHSEIPGARPESVPQDARPQFGLEQQEVAAPKAAEQQLQLPGAVVATNEPLRGNGEQLPADQGLFKPTEPVEAAHPRLPGLSEGAPLPGNFPVEDRTRDFQEFSADAGHTVAQPFAANRALQDYVDTRGTQTGNEYVGAFDASTGQVIATGTSRLPNMVGLPDAVVDRASDPAAQLVLHHNHPANNALSGEDIGILGHPGILRVVAHGAEGEMSSAELTPEYATARNAAPADFDNRLVTLHDVASDATATSLEGALKDGLITRAAANRMVSEAANHALAAVGAVDYISTRDLSEVPSLVLDRAIRAGAFAAREAATKVGLPVRNSEDVWFYRPPEPLSADRALEKVSGAARGPAEPAGPTDTAVRPAGGIGDRAQGEGTGVGRSLAEDDSERFASERAGPVRATREEQPQITPSSADPVDDVALQIANNSGGIPPGTYARHAAAALPGRAGNPPTKFLGSVEQMAIMPRTLAAMDWRSSKYWDAWSAKDDTTNTLRHRWSEASQDYVALSAKQRNNLSAVEELDRLNNIRRTDEGRQIVARNETSDQAELSKRGQTVVLDPKTTEVYHQRRAMFDDIWNTRMESSAKKLWPEGMREPPTTDPAAIMALAGQTAYKPMAKVLTNLADLMAGMKSQQRTGYVPLMRFGDYYISVKPLKAQAGFPEVARFELVESRDGLGKLFGKNIREGDIPHTAQDRIAELKKQYPASDYEIESGYLRNKADALRKLDIPAIEKLLITLQQKDADYFAPMADELRTQMYKELRAGYTKQSRTVPGYSTDFGRVTGAYTNWVANHAAELQHGEAIRGAQETYINDHPDPRVQRYWQKWADYQNNPSEEFRKLRQFGFYWQLAGNLSSTLLVATHGPMVAHATLGAGAGYASAGKALYGAFGEALGALKFDGKRGAYIDMESLGRTQAEKDLIQTAIGTGKVHPAMEEDLRGLQQNQSDMMGAYKKPWARMLNIAASNIAVADQMNRAGTLLGAYRLAQKPGMLDKLAKTWGDNQVFKAAIQREGLTPQSVAKFMVDEGLFVWGKRNRAPMQQGAGALLFQFKNFELNYLSTLYKFMTRMGPEGKMAGVFMLGGLSLLGGALSLPFADDVTKLTDWAGKLATGIDPMAESKLYEWMQSAGMSHWAAESVLRGPTRQLGVDLSSRLGFGDVASRNMSGIDALGSVPSMMYSRLNASWNRLQHGQTTAAVADVLPTAVRNVVRGTQVLPDSGLQSQYGNQIIPKGRLSGWQQAATALGFEPTAVARAYEARGAESRHSEAERELKSRLTAQVVSLEDQMGSAQKAGNTTDAEKMRGQIQSLLKQYPEIRVSATSLRAALRARENPEAAMQKRYMSTNKGWQNPYLVP